MKKITAKLKRKDSQASTKDSSGRITNNTLEEHRKRVISGGRKFKYPLQYARHKLVINTIVITVLALIVIAVLGWWRLYPAQSTDELMYRVTRVLPLPVASVDDQSVRYSDYLMKYKSAEHYLLQREQVSLSSEDGKRQVEYLQQEAMRDAVAEAYAQKLASEQGINVTDEELNTFLEDQRNSVDGGITERAYDSIINDFYGWSPDEYRHNVMRTLLRQKVAYGIDETARQDAETVKQALEDQDGTDLRSLAEESRDSISGLTYGSSGWVQRTNGDGGITAAARQLEKGQVSDIVTPLIGDGYYIIRLIDSNDTQVNYEYIRIPLRQFASQLNQLYDSDKVTYYINVPKPSDEASALTED